MKDFIFLLATQKKQLTFVVFAVLTLVSALQVLNLKINATPYLLEPTHPSRAVEKEVASRFNHTDQPVLILVKTSRENIFNRNSIDYIHTLTNKISELSLLVPADEETLKLFNVDLQSTKYVEAILRDGLNSGDFGLLLKLQRYLTKNMGSISNLETLDLDRLQEVIIDTRPVKSITSIFNTADAYQIDDELIIENIVDYPVGEEGRLGEDVNLDEVRTRALRNSMFTNFLLGKEAKSTTIRVIFNIEENDETRLSKIISLLYEITETPNEENSVTIAGAPVLLTEIANTMKFDNIILSPLVSLVIGIVLFLSFRNWRNVVIPLTITTITVIWTVGIMITCGVELNIITIALPVVLMTIAVADSVHFLSVFESNRQLGMNVEDSLKETYQDLFRPLLLTTLTTCCGFIAIAYSDFSFIRYFGIFATIGVFVAFLLTVFLLPIFITFFYKSTQHQSDSPLETSDIIGSVAKSITQKIISRKYLSLTLVILTSITITSLAINVNVDQSNVKSFSSETEFTRSLDIINQNIGGTFLADIWFSSDDSISFSDPKVINAMRLIKEKVKTHEEIGYIISPSDFVDQMHSIMFDHSPEEAPQLSQELIAQYYFLYEGSENREINDVLSFDYQDARMIVVGSSDFSSFWINLRNEIESYAKQILPSGVEIKFSGYGAVVANLSEIIVNTQIVSTFIGFVLVMLVMSIMFKSLLIGLISSVPLLFTIIGNFALMTIFNITVDVGNVIASVLVLAIGVDFSIHFISAVQNNVSRYQELEEAVFAAVKEVARPIVINSVSLACGFTVLLISSFEPIKVLGTLMATSMIVCAVTTLIIMPILLVVTNPKSLSVSE